MELHEKLDELHMALEGAVDQLVRSQRIAIAGLQPGQHRDDLYASRLERALAEVVSIRNAVREHLMKAKAGLVRPGAPDPVAPSPSGPVGATTIRIKKGPQST